MFELKLLSQNAIPGALEKAIRYRLLNEPRQAESICRDILATDAKHQGALVNLILALTEQFGSSAAATVNQTRKFIPLLIDEYQRDYFSGIICERQANIALKKTLPHAGYIAYDYFREAMDCYEKAEKNRPEHNDEALLRWNACARMIIQHKLKPQPQEDGVQPFLDV